MSYFRHNMEDVSILVRSVVYRSTEGRLNSAKKASGTGRACILTHNEPELRYFTRDRLSNGYRDQFRVSLKTTRAWSVLYKLRPAGMNVRLVRVAVMMYFPLSEAPKWSWSLFVFQPQ